MASGFARIIRLCGFLACLAYPSSSTAWMFPSDMSEAYQVLYCSSDAGKSGEVLIVLSGEHFKHLVDGGPVTEADGVWSAPYHHGMITVGPEAYSFMSGTEVETGHCANLSESMRSAMLLAAKENPEAFRQYAKDVVVGPTDWRDFMERLVSEANNDRKKAEAQSAELASDLKAAQLEVEAVKAQCPTPPGGWPKTGSAARTGGIWFLNPAD